MTINYHGQYTSEPCENKIRYLNPIKKVQGILREVRKVNAFSADNRMALKDICTNDIATTISIRQEDECWKEIYAILQAHSEPLLPLAYWRFKACISIHLVILLLIGFHTIGVRSFRAVTRLSKPDQSTAGSGRSRTGTSKLEWDIKLDHV